MKKNIRRRQNGAALPKPDVPDRGTSRYKGSEIGKHLACWRKRKEAEMTEEE